MLQRAEFLNNLNSISREFAENISLYYVSESNITWGITYSEVNRVSDELSRYFSNVLRERSKFVAVELSDCCFLPCLVLAVWKSGRSFAGAASQYTKKNTLMFLNSLSVKYLITDSCDSHNGETVSEFFIHNKKFFVLLRDTSAGVEPTNIDICYGIMTSGSTGQPKIIQVPWSCILPNANELSSEFEVKDSDCIFQASPYTFDPFFIELFMALIKGSSLMIVPNAIKLNSSYLLEVLFGEPQIADTCEPCEVAEENYFSVNLKQMKRPGVSILQMTPSFFKRWTEDEIKDRILASQSKLRILILGGEKFPVEILSLKSPNNKTRIFNIYGITEISCWAFLNEVTEMCHGSEVSLGNALRGIKHKISDNGEFCIGSESRVCLVDGETRSLRDTGDIVKVQDEKIYYVGRSNHIVKKYGIKINLTKVEEAFMNANKSIKGCCCVYDESNQKVALFYAPVKAGGNYLLVPIKDFSRKYQIPNEEISGSETPDYTIELGEIPLNSHGKCDRRKLQQHMREIHGKRQPESDLESTFAKVWSEALALGKPDLLSGSFTDLGGNSVSALEMTTKLEDSGLSVPQNFIAELLAGGNYESCLKCLKSLEKGGTRRKKAKLAQDDLRGGINLRLRWKFDLEKCVDATPVVFTYQGRQRVVVGSHSSKLSCLDFDSGQELWSVSLGDRIESGFRVTRDRARGFVGCYDHFVYCLRLSNGELLWKVETGDMIKSTPCLSTDQRTVYVPSYDKHLHCLSVVDGTLLEKLKLSDGGVYGTGAVSDSLAALYVGTLDGTCVAVSQGTNQVQWRTVLQSPVFASPCLVPRKPQVLFSEVLGVVHCLDAVSGTKVWAYKVTGNVYSSPVAWESNIIFGCHDRHLYCLHCGETTPEPRWRRQLDSPVFGKPSVLLSQPRPWACAATTKGFVHLCDLSSGTILASFNLTGEIFSSVVCRGDRVVFGCRDNNVYALEVTPSGPGKEDLKQGEDSD